MRGIGDVDVDGDGEQKRGRGNPTQVWSSRRRPAAAMVPWARRAWHGTRGRLTQPTVGRTVRAHNFLFSSSAPSAHQRVGKQKGSDQHHETVQADPLHSTSGTRHPPGPPIHPSQAETGFPELFHRWCSLLTAESSPTHLPSPPKTGPQSTPPLPLVSIPSPPVLPHLDNKNPDTPVQPFSFFCLAFPLLAFAFAAQRGRHVSRQARSGRPPEPTTRDDRLDRLESSLFSLPELPRRH